MPFSDPKPCFWLPDLACRECILKKKVICLSAFRLDSLWFQTWWTNFCPSKFIPFIVSYSPIKSDKDDSGCYFLISYCESQVGMHLEQTRSWGSEKSSTLLHAACGQRSPGNTFLKDRCLSRLSIVCIFWVLARSRHSGIVYLTYYKSLISV